MAAKFLIFCLLYTKVVYSQYYSVPAPSYPPYSYNYYSPAPTTSIAPTFGPPYPPPTPVFGTNYITQPRPTFGPTYPSTSEAPCKRSIPKSKKASSCPKCSPSTASAYFLSTPTEKVKATVLTKDSIKLEKPISPPPTYSCPLCNNFADVPLNPKIPPPPPVGCSVLPGIIDEIPTLIIPKDLPIKEPCSCLSSKKPILSDMYEKHKCPKNLRFDQDLLEGFLTGLGITL